MARNDTLSWGSGYCIADKIEWDIKETQWLNKIKSQKVVSRICNIYVSRCCLILNLNYSWQFICDMDTIPWSFPLSLVEDVLWFSMVSVRWWLCPRQCLFANEQDGCSVLLTHFRFDFELERKVATRLFVMWSLVCCFVHRWGAVSLLVAFAAAVCFEWTFPCKMPSCTIPASRWRFLLCWARCCWVLLSLNGVDCGWCCGYWLLYHIWIMLQIHQPPTFLSSLP